MKDITITFINRQYEAKADGHKFFSATVKGKFLKNEDDVNKDGIRGDFNDEESYRIRITQKSAFAIPAVEGVYKLSFKGEAWLDTREGMAEKRYLRINGSDFSCEKTKDLIAK